MAYIEAALWSSTAYGSPEEQEQDPDHEGHFDASFQSLGYDMSEEAKQQCVKDCEAFQQDNAELLAKWYEECGESPERAGHDFWLTRNGHGAGFWDRWSSSTPQGKIGYQLSLFAHADGDVNLYWTENGAAIG